MTETTIQERAKAAVAATEKKNEHARRTAAQQNIASLREAMVSHLKRNLGVEVHPERVCFVLLHEHDQQQTATVEIDGLIFAYKERERPYSYSPHLVLLRRCEKRDDCGVDVESDRINNLDDLGRILEEKPEHTECQVEYEEKERRSEVTAAVTPAPPTKGEQLLDALRDYIMAEVPEF